MKKKLSVLFLVFMMMIMTIGQGINTVTANTKKGQKVDKQQEVINVEEENVKDYENEESTEHQDKPLGLEDESTQENVLNENEANQDSTKIIINKSLEDNMEGFAPKIELLDAESDKPLFTLEEGEMPPFEENAWSVTIDTQKHINEGNEIKLRIADGEKIGVGEYKEIKINGKTYEVNFFVWGLPDKIYVSIQEIYKPEDQVLKVKKYWYDCGFDYEIEKEEEITSTGSVPVGTGTISEGPYFFSARDSFAAKMMENETVEESFVKELALGGYHSNKKILISKEGRQLKASQIPVSEINVRLYVDGEPTDQMIKLTEENNWEGEFDVKKWVNKYGSYHEHTLSLVEEGAKLDEETQLDKETVYESEINFLGQEYKVLSAVGKGNAYLVNWQKKCEDFVEIPVEKVWKTEDAKLEQDHTNLPDEIEVILLNGDKEVDRIKVTKENNWKAVFKDLPRYEKDHGEINYTIKEVPVEGYQSTITGDMEKGFIVTNTKMKIWTPLVPATRNIQVTKEWQNINGEIIDEPVENIEVELYRDGIATGTKINLNKQNNWSDSFDKLPVSETVESKPYEYTVKEIGEKNNFIRLDGKSYKVLITGTMSEGFKVTNKETPSQETFKPTVTSLKVEKEWEGIDVKDAPAVIVYLVKNGQKTEEFIKLNEKNNWQGEFKDLEVSDPEKNHQENVYTVVEDGEKNGRVKLNGEEFKVTYHEGKIINTKVEKSQKPAPVLPEEPQKPIAKHPEILPQTGKGSFGMAFVGLFLLVVGVFKTLNLSRNRE